MTSVAASLNPTRIIGLASDVFALLSCAIAWAKGRGVPPQRSLAIFLTGLEAAILIDFVFNARWLLHDSLAKLAIAINLYNDRSGPQHVALGLLVTAVAAGVGFTSWLFRDRPGAALAACGGILSSCCWCVEVISLHSVDNLIYRRVDGVTLVRLAWSACSLMTGVGVLWDTFAGRALNHSGNRPKEPPPTP